MTFRKISLTLLLILLSVSCAFAAKKKQPKYAQAHQLTPEQAALVEKAIGREKVLIKNIQQRTPLVETTSRTSSRTSSSIRFRSRMSTC